MLKINRFSITNEQTLENMRIVSRWLLDSLFILHILLQGPGGPPGMPGIPGGKGHMVCYIKTRLVIINISIYSLDMDYGNICT